MMRAVALELAPEAVPSARAVMEHAGGENFPVAARVLSREHRRGLLAIYGFARLADELGDELVGDRLAALDWLEQELDRAYAGKARHPLLIRLQQTLAERDLPRGAFVRLIDANRLDQRVSRYDSWEQLEAYCQLSANPVGELVLYVFGLASDERIELSNRVCTALQLVEHLQDLREDVHSSRIYLPARDLARFGCSHEELCKLVARGDPGLPRGNASSLPSAREEDIQGARSRLREAICFETGRARALLGAGVPLVASVRGRPKLALAGFVAGGRVALDGIERVGFDVLGRTPRPGRRRLLRAHASVLRDARA